MIVNFFRKLEQPKWFLYLIWLGYIFVVIPFLLLAFYCHPSADDYWQTNIAIEKGIWQAYLEILQTWSGRYFTMMLTASNPLVFHSLAGYKILPVVFFLSFLGSSAYFIRAVLSASRWSTIWFLTLIIFALYLSFMPTVAQVFYWMSGVLHYQVAHIMFLILFGLLIRVTYKQQLSWPNWFLAGVLIFLIAGSNETVTGIQFFLLFSLLCLNFLLNGKINIKLIGLFLIAAFGTALLVLSPGNNVRIAAYPNHGQFWFSTFYATAISLNNTFNWLSLTPVLLLTILYIPFAFRMPALPLAWQKLHPLWGWLLLAGTLFTGYFVSYWSKGDHAPPRVQDTIYLFFLFGWFLNIWITVQHLVQLGWAKPVLPQFVVYGLILICSLSFFQRERSNIRNAYADIFSGRALHYNNAMLNRYKFLLENSCEVCEIPAIQNVPKTIFFEEIPADTTWKNRYFSKYFGKKLMIMKEH